MCIFLLVYPIFVIYRVIKFMMLNITQASGVEPFLNGVPNTSMSVVVNRHAKTPSLYMHNPN